MKIDTKRLVTNVVAAILAALIMDFLANKHSGPTPNVISEIDGPGDDL